MSTEYIPPALRCGCQLPALQTAEESETVFHQSATACRTQMRSMAQTACEAEGLHMVTLVEE